MFKFFVTLLTPYSSLSAFKGTHGDNMQYLLAIAFALFFTFTAHAKVEFLNSPGPYWEQKILVTLTQVNEFLPAHWNTPDKVRIQHSPQPDLSYSFTKQLVSVGVDVSDLLMHEYAHLLLDKYIHEHCPGWSYFFARKMVQDKELKDGIADKQSNLNSLKQALIDFEKDEFSQQYIKNVQNSIRQIESQLRFLNNANKNDEFYRQSYAQLNYYKLLIPYHELFADAVVSLVTNNWFAMKNASQKMLELTRVHPALPAALTWEEFLNYRIFDINLKVETYSFASWENDSPYTQFAPFRSEFRVLVSNGFTSKSEMILKLAESIAQEFETQIRQTKPQILSLREKNLFLLERLKIKISAMSEI